MYACMYVCNTLCTNARPLLSHYVCMYVCVCVCVCMYACMYVLLLCVERLLQAPTPPSPAPRPPPPASTRPVACMIVCAGVGMDGWLFNLLVCSLVGSGCVGFWVVRGGDGRAEVEAAQGGIGGGGDGSDGGIRETAWAGARSSRSSTRTQSVETQWRAEPASSVWQPRTDSTCRDMPSPGPGLSPA